MQAIQAFQGPAGSSKRPWLSIGRSVHEQYRRPNYKLGDPENILSDESPPSQAIEAPSPFHSLLQHLTWRPTWPADQLAHLASARHPDRPVRLTGWPKKVSHHH